MTNQQKCEKVAALLERVAIKMRDPNAGLKMLKTQELTFNSLVLQLSLILKRLADLNTNFSDHKMEQTEKIKNTSKKLKQQKQDEWPTLISD